MSDPISRLRSVIAVSLAVLWLAAFPTARSTWAQQSGAGSSLGGGTAGFSGSASQGSGSLTGFSLSSRFNSSFGRFTGGSQSIGQTTAGAAAATSGVFGQGGNNAFGAGGFGAQSLSPFGRSMGFGMGAGFGNRQSMNRQGTSANKKNVLRTHMRLGFKPNSLGSSAISKRSTGVISRALVRESYARGPINVQVEGRVAVLTGTVQSEHGRDIAARLALLEPGISEVRNELIVDPAEPKPETERTLSVEDPHR